MLLVTFVQIVCSIVAVYFGARAAMSFGRDVRGAVFTRVGEFSAREVAGFGAPSLITRTTNDVQQVQMLVIVTCTMLVAAPIMCVGGVVMAIKTDLGLSWLMAVSVPVMVIAIGLIMRQMIPQFRLMQERIDVLNRVLREQITGIRVVRAFVREPQETERFAEANFSLSEAALRAGRLQALIFPTVMLVFNASSVAVLWFGAARVEAGDIQIGALTAFLAYLMQILMAVMMATFMLMMVPRAAVSADRIGEVLGTESSVVAAASPVTASALRGEVELRGVRFLYPGPRCRCSRTSASAPVAGQTTAIIGSTGAGKTTLLSLIPRLFDVAGGSVLVDGVDVRELGVRRAAAADRDRAAAAVPVHGHRRRRTCATATPTRPTRSCGRSSRSPRPATSSRRCPRVSRRRSRRAAPTSPAASGSASRSPARSCASPRSTCSTTRSRPSTSAPTPGCGPRCAPSRPTRR